VGVSADRGDFVTERLRARARRERADVVARQAARVLGERGCFELRIEEVAKIAGVGKGTVYLDHVGKRRLMGASLAVMCRELLDEMVQSLEGASDPGERLGRAIRFLAELPLLRPDLVVLLERRLVCAARWIGAEVSPYVELERYVAMLVEDAAVASSLEAGVDPRFAAQALLAVVSTPAWLEIASEQGPEKAERSLAHLMPTLLAGEDSDS
jgi:AcrR family transcriptional regulator